MMFFSVLIKDSIKANSPIWFQGPASKSLRVDRGVAPLTSLTVALVFAKVFSLVTISIECRCHLTVSSTKTRKF